MCEEGWCVELGQEGVSWEWGGGVGALKREGAGTPYELWTLVHPIFELSLWNSTMPW